ncbi:MAG: Pam3-gp28 family putative phage holin [Candidatus Hodarchaeales archaeon]|jgi:hypothetical protein
MSFKKVAFQIIKNRLMKKAQLLGIARHLLTIIGGGLVSKGVVEANIAEELIGVGMSIVGIVWSVKNK